MSSLTKHYRTVKGPKTLHNSSHTEHCRTLKSPTTLQNCHIWQNTAEPFTVNQNTTELSTVTQNTTELSTVTPSTTQLSTVTQNTRTVKSHPKIDNITSNYQLFSAYHFSQMITIFQEDYWYVTRKCQVSLAIIVQTETEVQIRPN
jgi:hypothetical protein